MQQGWIKLHRQIMDNPLYKQKRKFSKFEAWIDILLSVNHREGKVLIDYSVETVNRGEFITSEVKLANKWNWDRKTVRKFLTLLQQEEMILKSSTKRWTSITVINWDKYQLDGQEVGQEVGQGVGQDRDRGLDTNKNDKNDKNEKNKELVNDLFSRELLNQLKKINNYPFDIEKDTEFINSLLVDYPTLDIKEELKKWATYKLDKPLTKKSNARSQFRNWCKNAVKWQKEKIQKQKTWDNKAYQPWEPPRD